ncbi:hypothetical protein TSTA_027470 [Talaromyces stipitatus ATCC 10500]|uniref:Uncharacterized protein n=1 Tax=Talaromyces stipitatus (strain ATCC 10500 / CBS 375.48 / QM 6759 / NRRL 1006) TaxID=441959 RepID=B8M6J0_TALSN|nr:uncharacterized protein TSTA_027470 [Talaromyces stipitatus ATCC 10500]EED19452.1 hypothetical protein TSTA_027470 [Talaromyces stipitatus ATCC 10500]
MAHRIDLTPIPESTDVEHGIPFVIKWKNAATSHKMELWIGVHIPENLAHGSSKPKANANPEKPAEATYLMYLPGCNTYRMIERKCIFPLSEYTPHEFDQDGRDYADVYNVAQKTSDIRFWSNYTRKEYQMKGRHDNTPSLDFGQDVDVDTDDASELSEGNKDQSIYPPGVPQIQKGLPKRTSAHGSGFTTRKKAKTTQEQQPDGEELVDIHIGSGDNQHIKINKSSFLKGSIQTLGVAPYIFHPYLHGMTPVEFEPVYACLSHDDDLNSDLASVDNEAEDVLGDTEKIAKLYMLKDVHSIEDLKALIPRLGIMCSQSCLLGLAEMADAVIKKIQVAWNVYGRMDQLPLLLDFIEDVMLRVVDTRYNQALLRSGPIQEFWIPSSLTEIMTLYVRELPQRFCNLMNKYPSLQAEVLAQRAALCCNDKLVRMEEKFRQREPLTEASFVIPQRKKELLKKNQARSMRSRM